MSNSPRFAAEPPHHHGQPARTAVLLCNLGTPDAPTGSAVRRYLTEFLSDPRVVEIPRLLWLAILHGVILRTRPQKSALKYAAIWTDQGSPLKVWTEKQSALLQQSLLAADTAVVVRYAMRYGSPSIAEQLDDIKRQGATRVLILPAYPQFSGPTTASVFDAVYQWAARTRHIPELRFINHYHDHPGYIQALAARVKDHWQTHGKGHLVMSFHGVPERTLHLGDPYHCECHKTARLLTEHLELSKGAYSVTFQSRFGRAKWLEPYTEPTVRELARNGTERVDIICPGFTSDCLETLEEIALEVRDAFIEDGGKEFHYIPCLNDQPQWITALSQVAQQHMGGWPVGFVPPEQAQRTRQAALAMGATD